MKSLYLAAAVTLALGVSACGQAPAAGQPQIPAAAAATQKQPAPAGQKVSDEITKAITTTLERNYADQKLKVESVSTTPVTGLYEIVVNGKQIAYTDATGQYMFVGDLIQTDIAKSLTEERKAVLNAVDFNKLPFDLAIKEVRGNGELKIAVFSDADCPFCKRLEHEFAKMTNVTIYNFMMPLTSLHPDATRKTVQILCQPDPTKAWTEWMREGKMPPAVSDCAKAATMQQTLALSEQLGFNGTPTLVFPNGTVQSGYSPMPALEEQIRANQTK